MKKSVGVLAKFCKCLGSAVLVFTFFTMHAYTSSFYGNGVVSFVDLKDFVKDAMCEMRYATSYNFTGKVIPGYKDNTARITKKAAKAMKKAREILKYVECVNLAIGDENISKIVDIAADISRETENKKLNRNEVLNLIIEKIYEKTGKALNLSDVDKSYDIYTFKIFDAYRPDKAVKYFMQWAESKDTSMKRTFYPLKSKKQVISEGYVAKRSGHSRGSTLDLTLFNLVTGKDVDMGGPFDYFGEISNYDKNGKNVSEKQQYNRTLLRIVMVKSGFKPLETEWWHFTLKDEPYPNTYFDF